jgi:hypothetical protein
MMAPSESFPEIKYDPAASLNYVGTETFDDEDEDVDISTQKYPSEIEDSTQASRTYSRDLIYATAIFCFVRILIWIFVELRSTCFQYPSEFHSYDLIVYRATPSGEMHCPALLRICD